MAARDTRLTVHPATGAPAYRCPGVAGACLRSWLAAIVKRGTYRALMTLRADEAGELPEPLYIRW